jgi:hypothetical protein
MAMLHKVAYGFLIAVSVLVALFGLGDVLGGATVDPAIVAGLSGLSLGELQAESAAGYRLVDFMTRSQGLVLLITGILLTTILLIPYRDRRRWAWFATWALPAWAFAVLALYLAFGVAPDQPPPPPMVSGPLLGGLAAIALLVDRKRFAATPSIPGDGADRPPG